MNSKTKKRLTIVTLVIVAAIVVILAVVGGSGAAREASVAQVSAGEFANQRIKVSGNVVKGSYTTEGNVLKFEIYDPENAQSTLRVDYDGGVAATFGNDVTAICTGKLDDAGVLQCSELVTKCPSKYESGTEALEVSRLIEYGSSVEGKAVKVAGTVVAGSQKAAGSGPRFALSDANDSTKAIEVLFDGAVSEETLEDGASVVVGGSMGADGAFVATSVSLKG